MKDVRDNDEEREPLGAGGDAEDERNGVEGEEGKVPIEDELDVAE